MWRIIGTSDEVTTCECCGKSDLKKTVVMSNEDGVVYLGCECAARRAGHGVLARACKADRIRTAEETNARIIAIEADTRAYYVWLRARFADGRSTSERRRMWRECDFD